MTTLEQLRDQRPDPILLRTVAGSRAYNLHTPESNTDERAVFALPAAAYLALTPPVEHVQDDKGDIVYTGLRKFLELAAAGNPSALEMLYAHPDSILHSQPAADLLVAQRDRFVTRRCIETHLGYANQQIRRAHGRNKWVHNPQPETPPTRLQFCRVILGPWPGAPEGQPPIRPRPLADSGIDLEHHHVASLEHVRDAYRLYHYGPAAKGVFRDGQIVSESIPLADESTRCIGILLYDQAGWEQALRQHREYWQWRRQRNEARWQTQEAGEVDYDAKNMMHTFRLILSAEHIVAEGRPRVFFKGDDRDFLMKVRTGVLPYHDLVAHAEERTARIRAANLDHLQQRHTGDELNGLLRAATQAWELDHEHD